MALWVLNGAPAEGLDFVLEEPDGRPVTMFVRVRTAEGRFAAATKGPSTSSFRIGLPDEQTRPFVCAAGLVQPVRFERGAAVHQRAASHGGRRAMPERRRLLRSSNRCSFKRWPMAG